MRLKPLNIPHLMMLTISLCALVLTSACGNSNKAIILRDGEVRQLAKDTPIEAYVKDSKGVRTKVKTIARSGEYVVGDANGASKTPPPPPPVAPRKGPQFDDSLPQSTTIQK